jgi:Zn-dependent peptidase ImmA (M78 family)
MERPKKWSVDENIYVTEKRYDMFKLHRFIKRCLKGTNGDIKKILIRKDLLKEGYHGLVLFEQKIILIDQHKDNQVMLLLTVLHEIFHAYFRDYDDNRVERDEMTFDDYQNDVIEQRAEKSAINMLKWYIDNLNKLQEILELLVGIPIKKLTKSEKESI